MIVLPRIVAYIVHTVFSVAYQLPSGVPAAGGRLGIEGDGMQMLAMELGDIRNQQAAIDALRDEAMKEASLQLGGVDPEALEALQQLESSAPLPGTGDRSGLQSERWGN